MTSRRGFLSSILGLAAAPAIVSASSIMRVRPVEPEIFVYKASGRYNLAWMKHPVTDTSWMAVEESDLILTRPTTIIIPANMREQALKILNAEFDKAYSQHKGFA